MAMLVYQRVTPFITGSSVYLVVIYQKKKTWFELGALYLLKKTHPWHLNTHLISICWYKPKLFLQECCMHNFVCKKHIVPGYTLFGLFNGCKHYNIDVYININTYLNYLWNFRTILPPLYSTEHTHTHTHTHTPHLSEQTKNVQTR